MQNIRKGSDIELNVEKLAFGGKAIGRVDDFVVFLDRAIPGQSVRARVTRKKKQFAEGYVTEVLVQSPHYVQPFCPHFGICGGCHWQDLPYEEQLRWKRLQVLECLQHVGGMEEVTVEPVVPSPHTTWYRNKMEYTFSPRRWLLPDEIALKDVMYDKSFAVGLHARGAYDKIFDVQKCFLESPVSVEILRETRDWCLRSGLPAYSTRDHQGFWRFLVIREGKRTDQTLLHLLTSDQGEHQTEVDRLAAHLLDCFPKVTTFVHSVSRKKAQVASGDSSRTVFGPGFIEERLGEAVYRVSAHSFFQTNPYAAEKLYETVAEFCDFSGVETVWDLYCGTGSIAVFIASMVKRVLGIEVVEDAVADARENCRLNGVENCHFVAGDLKEVMQASRTSPGFLKGNPDVVITDPPRAGMHPQVLKSLLDAAPNRIVAVSCNPSTLARDLSVLMEHYEVKKVRPFDMFPHTPHIECVVKLERRASSR